MPLWVRKFFVDFVETGLGAIFGLTLFFPADLEQGEQVITVVGAALAGAFVSAARRAIPGLLAWLKTETGTEDPPAALGKPYIPGDKE